MPTRSKRKAAVDAVNAASAPPAPAPNLASVKKFNQRSLESSMSIGAGEQLDQAIADLFYGDNLKHRVADSPRFKRVIELAKCAPAAYKPPDRRRLGNDLLFSTSDRLRAEEQPLREAIQLERGTVLSDGWDTVERDHLINLLFANTRGAIFDGTVELGSGDHEEYTTILNLI